MPSHAETKTILLVEDESLIAMKEAALLGKHGFHVINAYSGKKAVELAGESPVDLVLMDIDLGKGRMDGTEAAERILKEQELPVVFLTSHCEKEMVDKVKGITRYGYVLKNAGEFVLIEAINMAFELFDAHSKLQKENKDRKLAEKQFEESAALYSHLMENSIDAVYLLSEEGKVLNVNAVACSMTGYSREELLQLTIDDIDPNYPSSKFIEFWEEKPEGSTILFETDHRHKSGEIIPVEVNGIFFLLKGIKYLFGVARDIRERKRVEEALRESEEKYKRFFENSPSLVLEADAETYEVLSCNPKMAETLGKPVRDIEGKSIQDILPPDIFSSRVEVGKETLKTNAVRTFQDERNGRTFLNTFIPLQHGQRQSVMTITSDITDVIQVRQSLEAERELFLQFMEQLPGPVFIKDQEERLLYCNSQFAAAAGGTADQLIGKKPEEYTSAEYLKAFSEENRQVLQSGTLREFEHVYSTEKGKTIWLTKKFPIKQPDGSLQLGMISFDITRRRELDETIRFQSKLLESVEQAVIATDLQGSITYCNSYAEKLYGWNRNEAFGKNILDLTGMEATHETGQEIMKALAEGNSRAGEFIAQRKDGSTFWAYVKDSPISNEQGEITGIIGISHDITERILTTKQLEEAEQNFRTLAENAGVGITVIQGNQIVYVNTRAENISGYSKDEMLTMGMEKMIEQIHPEDRDFVSKVYSSQMKKLQQLSEKNTVFKPIEYRHIRKDGTVLWTEAHTSVIQYYGRPALLVIHNDLSAAKKLMETLETNSERYRKAQQLGNVGNWEYNIQTEDFWGSDQAKRIYGFGPDTALFTTEEVESCILERERVHEALVDLIEKGSEYHIEFNILTKDTGEPKTIVSVAELEKDPEGKPIKVTGVIQDITERKEAEQELRKSELRRKNAQKLARIGYWDWYMATGELLWSEVVYDIFGQDPESFSVSAEAFEELIHPEDLNNFIEERERALAESRDVNIEHRILRADGKVCFVHEIAEIIRDDNGKVVQVAGVVQDITKRKQTEEALAAAVTQKEFLMQELNHRIKNNLLMVSSLIHLKNSALGEGTDLSDLYYRIDTIRIMHEKLYQSGEPVRVDMHEYIDELLNAIFSLSNFNVRIENRSENIHFTAKTAVPVGLIVNETATNAIQHGFRTGKEASFSVDLRLDEDSLEYTLSIANTGRKFPEHISLDNPETLGLRIISVLAGQLEGTIVLEREPETRFIFKFPMEY